MVVLAAQVVVLGGGGAVSSACANGAATCGAPAGAVPTTYSQVITPIVNLKSSLQDSASTLGTLTTVNNVYLDSTQPYPMTFKVTGNTTDITVNYTIKANDSSIPAGSTLPTLSPTQCTFAANSDSSCTVTATLGNAPAGEYQVIPSVAGAATLPPIDMTFQTPTQFTLPLGTYLIPGTEQHVYDGTSCTLEPMPSSVVFVNTLNGTYACASSECVSMSNHRVSSINLPFNSISHNTFTEYLYNGSWNNNVLCLF